MLWQCRRGVNDACTCNERTSTTRCACLVTPSGLRPWPQHRSLRERIHHRRASKTTHKPTQQNNTRQGSGLPLSLSHADRSPRRHTARAQELPQAEKVALDALGTVTGVCDV
jgi:hypothetical protein